MHKHQHALNFEIITEADIPKLTKVMTRSFDNDAQKHLNQEKGGPPGYDNGEFFQKWVIQDKRSTGYKIISNEQIVGGFLVWILESGENILGNIFIDPDYQDQGIGTRTWEFIETSYPNSNSWTLETPKWALKNHYFYEQKCGFRKINAREDSFIYKKEMRSN
jgi:hypothetical protein